MNGDETLLEKCGMCLLNILLYAVCYINGWSEILLLVFIAIQGFCATVYLLAHIAGEDDF